MSSNGRRIAVPAHLKDDQACGVPKNGQAGDSAASKDTGVVYIFNEQDDGTWKQASFIKASNPGLDDEFGTGLAMSGDGGTLAVGAPYEGRASNILMESGTQSRTNDDDELTDSGVVYLY